MRGEERGVEIDCAVHSLLLCHAIAEETSDPREKEEREEKNALFVD